MGVGIRRQWLTQTTLFPLSPYSTIPVHAVYTGEELEVRTKGGMARDGILVPFSVTEEETVVLERDSVESMVGQMTGAKSGVAAVFPYGSVVVFGELEGRVRDAVVRQMVEAHAKDGGGGRRVGSEWVREEFGISVEDGVENATLGDDCVVLDPTLLTPPMVQTLAGPLGQTVALEKYEREVDRILGAFDVLNDEVAASGRLNMDKEALFALIASNNAILTDLITLGLLDRSDTAWSSDAYGDVWDEMRAEFELADRFSSIDFKLTLVQHSSKFYLDLQLSQKSNTLELIIIALIVCEIGLSAFDIYGSFADDAKLDAIEAALLQASSSSV